MPAYDCTRIFCNVPVQFAYSPTTSNVSSGRRSVELDRRDSFPVLQLGLPAYRYGESLCLDGLREVYYIDANEARSKGYDEYRGVEFVFVITVCDKAKETCPVWPGQPIIAHWGAPDPGLAEGIDEQKYQQYKLVEMQIQRRIELFCALPFNKIDKLRLAALTGDIGKTESAQCDCQ